jgi:3-methylcrotonyl-CoA carboxylase alpha subunit
MERDGVVTTEPLQSLSQVFAGDENVPGSPVYVLGLSGPVLAFQNGEAFLFEEPDYELHHEVDAGSGAIEAPMPGRVVAVHVSPGDAVTKGAKLVTLEAMKMEHGLAAPFAGTVAEVSASEGAQVSEGAVLVRIEAAE